jgi:DNA primase
VRKSGHDGFRRLLENADSFIDFIAQTFEQEGKLSTPEGQAETVRTIVHSIAKMNDELKRNFYIKRVAEKYKIYESTLYRELEKHLGLNRREMERETERLRTTVVRKPSTDSLPPTSEKVPVAERDLLHAMFDGGTEVIRFVFENITLEEFTHPYAKTIAEYLLHEVEEGLEIDPSRLITELEDGSIKRFVADIIFSKFTLSKSWEEQGVDISQADAGIVARGAIQSLRRRMIERKIDENQRILKNASTHGENIDRYLERHQVYLQQLKELQ